MFSNSMVATADHPSFFTFVDNYCITVCGIFDISAAQDFNIEDDRLY